MTGRLVALLLLVLVARSTAVAADPALAAGPTDDELITELRRAHRSYVALGELARTRGGIAEVRAFGDLLARDHALADARLRALAGPGAATATPPITTMNEAVVERLEAAGGPEFDRQFATAVTHAYDDAVARVTDARREPIGSELHALLGALLPILEQHRTIAEHLPLDHRPGG